MKNTFAICKDARLQVEDVSLFLCNGADNQQPMPTITISVPSNDQASEWNPALVTIAYMIHAEACIGLSVYINCSDRPLENQIYAIEASHYLVEL